MTTVSVDGAQVSVYELVLVDEESAKILLERPESDRPEAIRRALKVGLIMMRDVVPIAKADFVRAEFLKLKAEMETYWKDEVRAKIDTSLKDFFDPAKGSLPTTLKQYLGEDGKLAQLFSDKHSDSVPSRLKTLLQSELTGEQSTFLKALDPSDEKGPVGKLAKDLRGRMDGMMTAIAGEKAAEAVAERGPQKGAPYEEIVLPALEKIAKIFGDTVEDVHAQKRAGDFVVQLDPETVPGITIKIAVDAKDSDLGLAESERVLRESRENWNAASAMLVFALDDQAPSVVVTPFGRLAEGYACVFDKNTEDSSVLEGAYRFVRLEAVRSVQRTLVAVEPEKLGEKVEQAAVKLRELSTVKRRITEMRSSLDELWAYVGKIQNEMRDLLDEAWQTLGMKKPMPEVTEGSSESK